MFISDFAIKRPIITVVTMIALIVFGFAAFKRLDTDEFPDIDSPIVFVAIAYPGASPDVVGGDSAQLNVNARPTDLAAFGVGIDQVVNAVRAQNLAAPVGQVNSALEQRSIRLEGRFEHPEEFNQLVVAQRGGQLITLGQVAIVRAGAAEPTSAALFNGTQAIGLDIVKSREYSTTAVADLVKARIAQLQKTLPA